MGHNVTRYLFCEVSFWSFKCGMLMHLVFTYLLIIIIIIIIIIINDSVYGAVIVTMVTARVHPVHLMNAD